MARVEGIRDGGAVDDCFHCALLYPDREDLCPRCSSRMHYEPAALRDAVAIEAELTDLIGAYMGAQSAATLEPLLTALHRYLPASADQLGPAGLTLARLRSDYERLFPPQAGLP